MDQSQHSLQLSKELLVPTKDGASSNLSKMRRTGPNEKLCDPTEGTQHKRKLFRQPIIAQHSGHVTYKLKFWNLTIDVAMQPK